MRKTFTVKDIWYIYSQIRIVPEEEGSPEIVARCLNVLPEFFSDLFLSNCTKSIARSIADVFVIMILISKNVNFF